MPMPLGTHTIGGDIARQKVLQYIKDFAQKNGYMPLINEVARGTGMYRNSVHYALKRLREAGKVDFIDGKMSRTLRLRDG